jgi:hypothetical protein
LLGVGALLAPALSGAVDAECRRVNYLSQPGNPARQPETYGDVSFLTGGVGAEEATALRRMKSDYPLALTFIEREGGRDYYTAMVDVDIRGADGARVLCIERVGPLLLVRLPAGDYRVAARLMNGAELTREVSVATGKNQNLSLVWQR